MPGAPRFVHTLIDRFDPTVFDARQRRTWIRLAVNDDHAWDVVVADDAATIAGADARPDAVLTANAYTWRQITQDLRSGGLFHSRGARQRGVNPSVQQGIHVRANPASAGFESATEGTTAGRSGSISGCRKRLNSTSPSAPAAWSQRDLAGRAEIWTEVGRHRDVNRVLDALKDVDVTLLDIAARDLGVAGQGVDVELDRGGTGVLKSARVVGPTYE